LKGCKENEVFCKAGLHVWNFDRRGTNERDDDKQVITQLPIKVTEALRHQVDECITQLATSTMHTAHNLLVIVSVRKKNSKLLAN